LTDVAFPFMSDDRAATGVLVTWFVRDGGHVETTTLIAEVAMDKVDAEVYPPVAGTIRLLVAEGAEVAQGTAIAQVD
jgi:pyruvate/2-oxoglutarate dehydrogenase complex dihydrolipoamide acyltransferase (E2) component